MTGFNWKDYAKTIGDDVGMAERAAAAGLVRSNFGKLACTGIRYMKFEEDGGAWTVTDIDQAEYAKRNASGKGRSTGMEFTFVVNLQEFNPNLDFNYERRVRVGSVDWRKTFVSSVEAVFGQKSMDADKRGATLGSLIGSYVEVHDVPQQPVKNDKHINASTGEPYRTISIAQVFKDKEVCRGAYVDKFGEPEAGALSAEIADAVYEAAADKLTAGKKPVIVCKEIVAKKGLTEEQLEIIGDVELTKDQVRPLVDELVE